RRHEHRLRQDGDPSVAEQPPVEPDEAREVEEHLEGGPRAARLRARLHDAIRLAETARLRQRRPFRQRAPPRVGRGSRPVRPASTREDRIVEDIRFDDIEALKGKITDTFGEWSEPAEVTQDMINRFADLTGDHQWIHVDVERAKRESPFGGTIAHGFL